MQEDALQKETVNLGKKGKFTVHKGALHRALGVAEGKKLSPSMLSKAANSSDPHVRRMAASARGLKAMHKKGRFKV